MPGLSVNSVGLSFTLKGGRTVTALDDISLEIRDREFAVIVGPSGCGKSTLFNIIGGLEAADRGRVLVDGHPIDGSHKDIGMVFQEESTFPWRTVIENVAFPLEVAGIGKREREEKAMRFVRLVGLEGFERRYPAELSGGMRQRAALARTLCAEPRILLMDEPFAALDEQTRMLLGEKLIDICQSLKQTTLFITHNLSEAVQLSDRVLVMSFRPGHIKRAIDIDLPRPRGSDVIASEAFAAHLGTIWNELKSEAAKGLQAMEAARLT
ncbi:MAG: ABC transporter ATP-binding protein [Rhodospirillaceae bacterium]|nr:ABC transporter ATP-binding protein [Rhodospirillaceae bacterium]